MSLSTLTISLPSRGRRSRVDLHPWHLVCHLLHGSRRAVVLGVWGVRSRQVPSSRDKLLSSSRPKQCKQVLSNISSTKEPWKKGCPPRKHCGCSKLWPIFLLPCRMQMFLICSRYNQLCFSFKYKKRLVAATFLPVTDYGDLLHMNASYSWEYHYHHDTFLRFITSSKPLTHHCGLYFKAEWSTFIYKEILGLLSSLICPPIVR